MFNIAGSIKLFALDLDGTLYRGQKKVAGAITLIDYLRDNFQVFFFTNNSTKTAGEIHEKLNSLGIECRLSEVYTSAAAAAMYLNESGLNNLYVIGSDGFRSELEGRGLHIVDNDSADNLVVGFDADFNYTKIATAFSILLKGGKFIACNEDGSYPVGESRYMPGCGAMVGAIAASAAKKPDFIVGKPNTYILSKIAGKHRIKHDEILVVGDSYESDVMMALNFKSKAILINPQKSVINKNMVVLEDLHKTLLYIKEH
ncbi:hypothetical protein D1BOALGB6SA_9582 [Olavius sp. associated proteobacterium Delta 1]|nr:hypothetical protein D1BOALGB6SA_9582 [Olavius sp. associated proteobacterium Delta 1]